VSAVVPEAKLFREMPAARALGIALLRSRASNRTRSIARPYRLLILNRNSPTPEITITGAFDKIWTTEKVGIRNDSALIVHPARAAV
jgi:hypothetical protein